MAKIYLGNVNIGGSGIVPTNTLPTANETNYNKHELYLYEGELKYIDYSNSTYEYKTLASSDLVTTISFTIAGTPYQAEDGMTWSQWVASAYNTNGFTTDGSAILNSSYTQAVTTSNTGYNYVSPSSTITADFTYYLRNYNG